MKLSSVEQAMEAMRFMERGKPYALRAEDSKRKLAAELRTLCREIGVTPVVIGGLAVGHHGYARFTAHVDVLMTRDEAALLYARLKKEPGWKRYAEGFKNTYFDVGLDICVEGERTSPRSDEVFPSPRDVRTVRVRPIPVVALAELIALKVKSGRARDDADVVELLKRHPSRIAPLRRSAARFLSTRDAKARLEALASRALQELG
ncbi:MAG: hypothetical protein HY293_12200 [Planctomycetes bacterium]|nr:hypothetical protein [Planctomycetota bacterium]